MPPRSQVPEHARPARFAEFLADRGTRKPVDSERQRGVLVHGLRHTFATDLTNASVNVYELKTLLGHELLATSQRYIDGAGQQNRAAAARNPLCDRLTRN